MGPRSWVAMDSSRTAWSFKFKPGSDGHAKCSFRHPNPPPGRPGRKTNAKPSLLSALARAERRTPSGCQTRWAPAASRGIRSKRSVSIASRKSHSETGGVAEPTAAAHTSGPWMDKDHHSNRTYISLPLPSSLYFHRDSADGSPSNFMSRIGNPRCDRPTRVAVYRRDEFAESGDEMPAWPLMLPNIGSKRSSKLLVDGSDCQHCIDER
jgi:hypothetical protein